MWRDGRERVTLTIPTTNGDEDESHNYEDEADFYTARRLSTNSFRWLWTANARENLRLKTAETSLIKEKNRVQNAIERQQRSLRSRSFVLRSLVQAREEEASKQRKVGVSALTQSRPHCPTPGAAFSRNRRCELPQITVSGRFQSLQSRCESLFSVRQHVTGTRAERSQQSGKRWNSKLLSVDALARQQDKNRKTEYLQLPLPRSKENSNIL
ncbi:uncharacterized protein LOC134179174 [Corticium candelabrum]|uniref:uncharacterized protein LOC134179174 n=1 Tax=Corticium candelabrum TaxID=121492 RepID=UPI002E26E648|nr:uncharacterized protein LOC134179174 [Corticium candelabrum]